MFIYQYEHFYYDDLLLQLITNAPIQVTWE